MKQILFLPWLCLLGFTLSHGQSQEKPSSEITSIPNTLQFYVFGDWGRKGQSMASADEVKNQVALAKAMDLVGNIIKPEFLITTGDNFYPAGVKNVTDPRWKETFEDIYTGPNLQMRWYVSLGNHDHGGKVKGEIEYDQSNEKRRWYLPASYYSQVMTTPDGALVKFIFIDTTPMIRGGDKPQVKWLEKELQDDGYDWKFVVGHHPLYSGNFRKVEQSRLRKAIEQVLITYKVDGYFCGHDHNLQYLKKDKINYFISGAGSEIYKSDSIEGLTQYVYCKEGVSCSSAFMVFSLNKSAMVVQMIDAHGQLVYRNKIERE